MLLAFTMKSFRILLNAVPRWMLPFAYGGPSCKTNTGLPFRASRICSYKPSASHCASIFGSAIGRFAFIGKSVFGRFTVFFRSTVEAFIEAYFHRIERDASGEVFGLGRLNCQMIRLMWFSVGDKMPLRIRVSDGTQP